jgi:hypothetical protein
MSNSNNFSYKEVNITGSTSDPTITDTTTSTYKAPGYNLLVSKTNYTGLRPLTFGYTYKSGNTITDMNTISTAKNTIYYSTQPVNIPTDCKSIRVSGIGGGGGTGGTGGKAEGKGNFSGNTGKGFGGEGGSGGYGQYKSTKLDINSATKQLTVTIGGPGANGNKGKDYEFDTGGKQAGEAPAGNNGGQGGNTSIQIGNNASIIIGLPGNGGTGGKGGTAYVNAGSNTNGTKGNVGTPGNETTQQSSGNFTPLAPQGNPGISGALQVVWLYD